MTTREDLWELMAEQFLDTETRTWIPKTALACVELGLSEEAAFDVWAYEVTPAVWRNIWDIAGEWAGWDRQWLVAEIRRKAPRKKSWRVYRAHVHFAHDCWVAIAACIRVLWHTPEAERSELVGTLTWLAAHYLDFGTGGLGDPPRDACATYEQVFLPIFTPLACGSDRGCDARVRAALQSPSRTVFLSPRSEKP
jgi:hypothetical protein